MKVITVYRESIFHYQCGTCQGYFAISDREPSVGGIVCCPDPECRAENQIVAIEDTPLKPLHKPKEPDSNKV